MKKTIKFFGQVILVICVLLMANNVFAAGGHVESPVKPAPDRYVYYPGSEELGKEEIRLISLGTGMPAARRSQAATCWLVELGNGDKFLFDIGTGANANMAALMIPFDYLAKVFLTHLHTDHWGDLPGLWAGGWTSGRTIPLEIWGPSGATPEMGTKYAVEHFLKLGQHDPSCEPALSTGQDQCSRI
jgi:ribonuclease Z